MENVQQYHIRYSLPKNVELLTRTDVLKHQMEVLTTWKPSSDVWSLLYGRAILAGAAGISGIYINQRFRAKLQLRSYGSFITKLGLFMTPAVTLYILQTRLILYKMLQYEVSCPFCLESKSALIQNFCGLVLPLIGAPFANFSIAAGTGRSNVPYQFDFKGMARIVWSIYRPLLPKFATIFTVQSLLAGFVTYSQVNSFFYIEQMQYLIEQERNMQPALGDP